MMLDHTNKALTTVADSLRSTPGLLALLLFNILVLGLVAWAVHEQRAQTFTLLERCFP